MNYRFSKLLGKGLVTACLAVACGGFTACHDDYDLDDEGNYPSWLGQSIYEELSNPSQANDGRGHLSGTFSTYLRLVDDLGYTETLRRTGSKTVFPANDEAFNRFFASNSWGVKSYDELNNQQKRQLLYSSMLDNAILVEMLSNVNTSDGIQQGVAMKHQTNINVIDNIETVYNRGELPANNAYWDRFTSSIALVKDATRPMMVHFTGPQLIQNSITTTGQNSDFKVLTGDDYTENAAYIFRDKIVNQDITCQNGYIHQVQDVLTAPGNVAEVIRSNGESNLFSRMLDRFSVPFYTGATTTNYNDYAQQNGLPLIDSVYQMRYFSERSQGAALNNDPYGNEVNYRLAYDPGWNAYTNANTGSNALSDICAIFVPTDSAMREYFVNNDAGRNIINLYGKKPNTMENLEENIDSIPINIIQTFLRDLMKPSFIDAVPSKFGNVVHDGSGEPMDITLSDIHMQNDGKYDVKIADNGVAYMLNRVIVPDEWASVLGPVLHSSDKLTFYYLTQLGKGSTPGDALSINFYAFLLAMNSNYALFVPNDAAFDKLYVDPAYLGHTNNRGRALHFYRDRNSSLNLHVSQRDYNLSTGELGDSTNIGNTAASLRTVVQQIKEILNTHTVVLNRGQVMGQDRYYLTKNGCGIDFDHGTVASGNQIDGQTPASNIVQTSRQANGTTYVIDQILEPSRTSVYSLLNQNKDRFSKFYNLCTATLESDSLTKNEMLNFAGIDTRRNAQTQANPSNAYRVFTDQDNSQNSGLDRNVYFFNSFNYTLYAPNNAAMDEATGNGLPTWDDVAKVVREGRNNPDDAIHRDDSIKARAMIEEINEFIRYHFQDNSVFADNSSIDNNYATASSNELGVHVSVHVTRNGGTLTVHDAANQDININANDRDHLVNKMTRDMIFNSPKVSATSVSTSSFAVVHEISTPLCRHARVTDFGSWKTKAGAKRLANQSAAKLKLYR